MSPSSGNVAVGQIKWMRQQRQRGRRPNQMDAHQQRQKHPDEHRGQCQKIILEPDNFVVQAEDPLSNEPLRGCVRV